MESMLCLFDLVNFESLGICSGDGKEGMKGGCKSFYAFWRTNGNFKRRRVTWWVSHHREVMLVVFWR